MPAAATPGDRASRSPAPLRGRDEELERIGERVSAARSSVGSVVTIAGDPGLGKTRLLEEAARIARRIGVRFVYAAADPSESVVPFSSLMTALFEGGDPLVDPTRTLLAAPRARDVVGGGGAVRAALRLPG
jgi:predicted ATPase